MDKSKDNGNDPGSAWAVVTSGALRLMCEVPVSTVPGDIVKTEACEYRISSIPVQVSPHSGPVIMFKAECAPLHNIRDQPFQLITAKVDNIIFFRELEDADREVFERQIGDMKESIRMLKLKRDTGITL